MPTTAPRRKLRPTATAKLRPRTTAKRRPPPPNRLRQHLDVATVPLLIAAASAALILIPATWITRAVNGDPNLTLALGQIVTPTEIALRTAASYGIPAGAAALVTLIAILADRVSHKNAPRYERLMARYPMTLMGLALAPITITHWQLYIQLLITAGSLRSLLRPPRTHKYRTLRDILYLAGFGTGIVLIAHYNPFPYAEITQTQSTGDQPTTLQVRVVQTDPTTGIWVLLTDTDTNTISLEHLPADTITNVNYKR